MPRAAQGSSDSFARRYGLQAGALVTVFAALLACVKWFEATPWARWQAAHLLWNFATHILLIVVAVAAAVTLKRSRADYGLASQDPTRDLKLGLLCGVPLALLPLFLQAAFGKLTLENRIAEFWLSTIVFQVLFVGFGEELFFRGFLQSEWNRLLPRRFHIGRVRFGGGLIVTALLFGVVHWLNDYNPLLDHFELDWSELAFTTLAGIILGFARELTGSLLTAVVIHVGADVYPALFVNRTAGDAGLATGWSAAAAVLIFVALAPVTGVATKPE